MTDLTRRTLVKGGTALGAAAALSGPALLDWAKAWAQASPWKPEKGAKLSMLRWKYFVQSEDDAFVKLIDAFTKATGVPVQIARESYEDVQPKASVAANTGTGPDIFWGLYSLPHLFPQKCVDMTDVADYLGKKYGGWVDSAVKYGKSGNKWIAVPICYSGALINYRLEASKKAGFSKFPDKTDAMLEYAKAMKAQGTPGGMALGHASGDGNTWVHWALWAHGGQTVDANDKVIINSPETVKALEFAKALYDNSIPGTASWNDGSNNKAFLAKEVYWTNNGISIYVAAQNSAKDVAADMDHAYFPIGPVGKVTELHLMYPALAMTYTKNPQACKALIAFMLEADNFNPWLQSAKGYLTHCLNAYDKNPIWTADPKTTPYRDVAKRSLTAGGLGSVGEKAATAIADFIVVDMFANYATGRENAKGAIAIAERQLKRIYR
ncbi:ABC transporter substrate-binding protein [Pseudolabrys sp. FHR47]|uniref:ABC transporter substrate-binding protein n=1 Tax=Pseudolabrys sp. FHR47 TaxID=2562284 RepID=UPI0010BF0735|nr:extracellular solute-binding protein [Pseudolabrys sp. FHR47]